MTGIGVRRYSPPTIRSICFFMVGQVGRAVHRFKFFSSVKPMFKFFKRKKGPVEPERVPEADEGAKGEASQTSQAEADPLPSSAPAAPGGQPSDNDAGTVPSGRSGENYGATAGDR